MKQDKLYAELSYLEKVALTYRKGSMLNRFYLFLARHKTKVKGGKKSNES